MTVTFFILCLETETLVQSYNVRVQQQLFSVGLANKTTFICK